MVLLDTCIPTYSGLRTDLSGDQSFFQGLNSTHQIGLDQLCRFNDLFITSNNPIVRNKVLQLDRYSDYM